MVDDSDAIKQLRAKNASLETQEPTLQAIGTDESATDAIIASFQGHVDSLMTARAATDATLNAANLKAELRATELILTDFRDAFGAVLAELRKHRQILRYIKDNYTSG